MRLPDGVQRVARLKFSATATVTTLERTIEVELTEKEAKRGVKEGFEIEVRQAEPYVGYAAGVLVRIRAKGLTGEELSKRPAYVELHSPFNRGLLGLYAADIGPEWVDYKVEWKLERHEIKVEDDEVVIKKAIVHVADGVVERPVYAEFRDLPLR